MTTAQVHIDDFLQFVFDEFHFDVRGFSRPPLLRRISAIQAKFHLADLEALRKRLMNDPHFFEKIFPYFLISTTEMFRHPAFFAAFTKEVIPYCKTFADFRIWIAGCSTGEELFSYLVLLHEHQLLDRCSVYATDLNVENLKNAKQGMIELRHMRKYSENYFAAGGSGSLSDYFTTSGQKAYFDPALLKNVCFSDHCLVTDQSFSEFQFISCRNVMIYFNRDLQHRTVKLFLESLSPRGYLGLGSKESLRLSAHSACFDTVDRGEALYRKRTSQTAKERERCH